MASPARMPRRFRSWRFLFAVIWAVIFTGAISITLWLLVLNSHVNAELNRLRTAGWPTTRKEVAVFNRVPADVQNSTQLWLDIIGDVTAENLSERGRDLPLFSQHQPIFPLWNADFPELQVARDLLHEVNPQLIAIHKAIDAGGEVRFSSDVTPLKSPLIRGSRSFRDVARLLSLDAYIASRDGDCERAFQDVSDLLSLPRLLRNDRETFSQLSRMGIFAYGIQSLQEILPACDWDDEKLHSLQSQVIEDNFKDGMNFAFRESLAADLSSVESLSLPLRIYSRAKILKDHSHLQETLSLPLYEAIPILRELEKKNNEARESRLTPHSSLISGATSLYAESAARATARQRCAAAAIGMHRHRLRHGSFPPSPRLIDSDLLVGESATDPDVHRDPFDGQPMRFREQNSFISIYSVGDDLRDNGGDICIGQCTGTKDIGIAVMR